jgi:periplasmic copper chaperone A
MSTPRRARVLAACAAVIALAVLPTAGCSSTTSASTKLADTVTTTSLVVSGAYINAPVVTDQTGAFAVITNATSTAVRLVSIAVPSTAAKSASVHTMAMVDGKMAMVPVKGGLLIPANGHVQLKPGGFHIMLMMPMLTAGQSVPMTFTFSDGTKVTAKALVKKVPTTPIESGM